MVEISIDAIHSLSRAEYDRIVELGLFEDARLELLYGQLVGMTPIGAPHSSAIQALTKLLLLALHTRAEIRVQMSFAATDDSEPEPDIAIVPLGRYADHNPTQAHLLIEVSQTSLDRDRTIKARLYAECGVPEYWVVNLIDDIVEVHTDIANNAYTNIATYSRGDSIALRLFPDVSVAVDDILGPT